MQIRKLNKDTFNKLLRPISFDLFFRFLVLSWGIAILFAFLKNSYLGLNNSEIQNGPVADNGPGFCNKSQISIGVHTFGDFCSNMFRSSSPQPWRNGFEFPPISIALLHVFKYLGSITSFDLVFALYLIASATALIFPVWHMTFRAKYIPINAFWILSTLSLVSAVSMATIDRGNHVIFAVPFIYLLLKATVEKSITMAGISILIMTNLKQQFVLLFLIILIFFGLKSFIKWLGITASIFLASFVLFPNHLLLNIYDFFDAMVNYQHRYGWIGDIKELNLSITNTVASLLNWINFPNTPKKLSLLLTICFVLIVSSVALYARRINKKYAVILILLLPILTPILTFKYYAVILLPCFLFLCAGHIYTPFKDTELYLVTQEAFFGSRINSYISTILFLGIMVPIPISIQSSHAVFGVTYFWQAGNFALSALFLVLVVKIFSPIIFRSVKYLMLK